MEEVTDRRKEERSSSACGALLKQLLQVFSG
jgi:hypothetical protein